MERTIVNMRKHDHLKHSKLSEIRIHEGPGLNWSMFFGLVTITTTWRIKTKG